MEKVWLSSPHIGDKEQEYVNEAFLTNWLAPLGPNVNEFENQLTEFIGVKGAVSLISGTAALHLALIALGVKEDDIVLCQSFTFAASAFPICYLKANPVFIDSEENTWNIDPELLEKSIKENISQGKKPAAIVIVHLYGMPAKMTELEQIASNYNIPIIEDAAEALGSSYGNKKCGSFGKIGILSFNGNKIITTSGGGALLSDDENIVKQVRHLSAQSKEAATYYLHKEVGYNYRMSNICAGIGRGQLEVLEKRVEKRRRNFEIYKSGLEGIKGIRFIDEPLNSYSNRWLTTILFDEKVFGQAMNEKIRIELERHNIESRPLWKPLHQQPIFSNCKSYINGVSDKLFNSGLCLPSGSNIDDNKIEDIVTIIKKSL